MFCPSCPCLGLDFAFGRVVAFRCLGCLVSFNRCCSSCLKVVCGTCRRSLAFSCSNFIKLFSSVVPFSSKMLSCKKFVTSLSKGVSFSLLVFVTTSTLIFVLLSWKSRRMVLFQFVFTLPHFFRSIPTFFQNEFSMGFVLLFCMKSPHAHPSPLRQSPACSTGQTISIAHKIGVNRCLKCRRQNVLEMFSLRGETSIVLVVSGHLLSWIQAFEILPDKIHNLVKKSSPTLLPKCHPRSSRRTRRRCCHPHHWATPYARRLLPCPPHEWSLTLSDRWWVTCWTQRWTWYPSLPDTQIVAISKLGHVLIVRFCAQVRFGSLLHLGMDHVRNLPHTQISRLSQHRMVRLRAQVRLDCLLHCGKDHWRNLLLVEITLKEVHPTIVSGLALQAWAKGSWPREKESVKAGVACDVGKVCSYTL